MENRWRQNRQCAPATALTAAAKGTKFQTRAAQCHKYQALRDGRRTARRWKPSTVQAVTAKSVRGLQSSRRVPIMRPRFRKCSSSTRRGTHSCTTAERRTAAVRTSGRTAPCSMLRFPKWSTRTSWRWRPGPPDRYSWHAPAVERSDPWSGLESPASWPHRSLRAAGSSPALLSRACAPNDLRSRIAAAEDASRLVWIWAGLMPRTGRRFAAEKIRPYEIAVLTDLR